ncbi:MAG: STAS/SEC14 domain-containing protein [Anaerolineae bacterium]|nr:STAS/SEC14 domain-containing protein [Anaerolineae bacterium]MDW8172333.1 hypothetical protein [Anaerolineae bacterium]
MKTTMATSNALHIIQDAQNICTCVFFSSSREAIDEWMSIIEKWQVRGLWYGRQVVRLLVDASQVKGLPLRYLLECLADYNRAYPGLQAPNVRLAYLYSADERVPSVFSLVARLMSNTLQADYFPREQLEAARAWLLSNDPPIERTLENADLSDWR